MLPRFFDPHLDSRAERLTLPAAEAHHARVLRLRAGDRIEVFSGREEVVACIERIDAREVVAAIVERRAVEEPPRGPALELAQAILKPEAMDLLVRQATELGVSAIAPLVTARVARGHERGRRARMDTLAARRARWERVALAACKQCHRATVPQIDEVRSLEEYLGQSGGGDDRLRLILIEPAAGGGQPNLPQRRPETLSAMTLLAGPEGGWAPAEVSAARGAGFLPASLGTITLRAETASIAAVAIARFHYR